jgi:enterochelin esterase-like enzyme
VSQYFVSSPNSTGPFSGGHHPISVYLPPGYNPDCSQRYPVLYLQHGGGGNDVDWTTQGFAGVIEDNLLAAGMAKPMVIVMPNFNNTASITDPTTGLSDEEDGFRQDLAQSYIPWAQSHFCVRSDRAGRAYAGLSQGGAYGQNILENQADLFAYYGIWSPACIDVAQPDCGRSPTIAELHSSPGASSITAVHFGSGWNDFFGAETTIATEAATLNAAGIRNRLHMTPTDDDGPATPALDPGNQVDVKWERQTSHTWDSWREQLRDALITTFFQLG